MKLWLDAQLSPVMAPWLSERFGMNAVAIRDLGLLQAKDRRARKTPQGSWRISATPGTNEARTGALESGHRAPRRDAGIFRSTELVPLPSLDQRRASGTKSSGRSTLYRQPRDRVLLSGYIFALERLRRKWLVGNAG